LALFDVATQATISPYDVSVHPAADLAVLHFASPTFLAPFWGFVANYGLGEEYMCFGFPFEDLPHGGRALTPRLFMGYFQRLFQYGHGPFRYHAVELSSPAPQGLSGGPLFRPAAPQMLTGLVTGNVQSSTVVDYLEETHESSGKTVYKTARIVEYGVALLLDEVGPWLDPIVPPPPAPIPWPA
jgi:hypothetical protein